MKFSLMAVMVVVFSVSAEQGQPSMKEPNWSLLQSQDSRLTANTKFAPITRRALPKLSLADIINNNAKEFKSGYYITNKVLKQFID